MFLFHFYPKSCLKKYLEDIKFIKMLKPCFFFFVKNNVFHQAFTWRMLRGVALFEIQQKCWVLFCKEFLLLDFFIIGLNSLLFARISIKISFTNWA